MRIWTMVVAILVIFMGNLSAEEKEYKVIDNLDNVKKLIQDGMNINEVMKGWQSYHTPLIEACLMRDYKMAQWLINHGADVNARAETKRELGLKSLEEKMKPTKGLTKNGETPLIILVKRRKYQDREENIVTVKLLLEKGANINATSYYGTNALFHALWNKDKIMSRFLIEQGIDLNAICENKNTALMTALEERLPDILKLLVEKGADLNAKNKYGYTLLMLARLNGYDDLAEYLISKGADQTVKDSRGLTEKELGRERKAKFFRKKPKLSDFLQ